MPTTQPHADPIVDLFSVWQRAHAAAKAAGDSLEAWRDKGENLPFMKTLLDGETDAHSLENKLIDLIMATPAETPAGAICKSIILANLAGQGDDPLVIQFIAAIQPDFERLLTDLTDGKELPTS